MELINQIAAYFLSVAGISAIIIYLAKMIIGHFDKRELERYKTDLLIEVDKLKLEYQAQQQMLKSREIELTRWSSTLLSSINGLIGRLNFIKDGKIDINDDYYKYSTVFYFSQFLCWMQIFRIDRNGLIFSPNKDEINLVNLIKDVSVAFRNRDLDGTPLRSLEQRYVAESMIVMVDGKQRCIDYKEFCEKFDYFYNGALKGFIEDVVQEKAIRRTQEILKALIILQQYFFKLINEEVVN
jgi:hypothetical protein